MTAARKSTPPKKQVYSDGEGGTLTEEEWLALPPAERERMQKLVDKHIENLRYGTP
jgi:hypothetical protein